MTRRNAIPILALLALTGCASPTSPTELITLRPGLGWTTESSSSTYEVRRLNPRTAVDEPVFRSAVSPQKGISLSDLIAARQLIAEFAGKHALSPRNPTPSEVKSGWTEAFSRPDGATLLLREAELARELQVSLTEGSPPRLRPLFIDRLGLNVPPPPPQELPRPTQRPPRRLR